MSQKFAFIQGPIVTEVVISKIKATAPPCRFPPILHSSFGTTKLNRLRQSFGFALVGVYLTHSSLSILARMASWP